MTLYYDICSIKLLTLLHSLTFFLRVHAAGLSSSSFYKHHSAIHDTIKGRLVPSYLTNMCPILSQEFYTSLLAHGQQGEMDLMDFVRDAMFEAVVKQLFGHDNVPQEKVCELSLAGPFPAFQCSLLNILVLLPAGQDERVHSKVCEIRCRL